MIYSVVLLTVLTIILIKAVCMYIDEKDRKYLTNSHIINGVFLPSIDDSRWEYSNDLYGREICSFDGITVEIDWGCRFDIGVRYSSISIFDKQTKDSKIAKYCTVLMDFQRSLTIKRQHETLCKKSEKLVLGIE